MAKDIEKRVYLGLQFQKEQSPSWPIGMAGNLDQPWHEAERANRKKDEAIQSQVAPSH